MSGRILLDGSLSRLYMHFDRPDHPAQGMDVWGDRAYVLYDTGLCGVYDLISRSSKPIDLFKLGSHNEGIPTRDYRNHANSCMFAAHCAPGNHIPLLYVTAGAGTGADEDGYFYRCAVENLVCVRDQAGRERYRAQTIQTITYRPGDMTGLMYENPCWGCPAFFVDSAEKSLYIFSARYRTKRGFVPEGEKNTYLITRFRLPELSEGSFIRLTPQDILDQFTAPSDVMFTQGGTLCGHWLVYTFGIPKYDYPNRILAFDMKKRCIGAQIDHLDQALCMEEIECCAVYKGKLLCNTSAGGIYEIRTAPFREETT